VEAFAKTHLLSRVRSDSIHLRRTRLSAMSSLYYNHPFWPSPRAARIAKLLLKKHEALSVYWQTRPVKPAGRLTHDKALKVMADYLGLSVHAFLHIKPVDAILRLNLANTEAHAYRILGNITFPAWWMSGVRMSCCVCLRQQPPPERGATVACERTAAAPAPAAPAPAAPAPAAPAPAAPAAAAPAPAPAAPAPAAPAPAAPAPAAPAAAAPAPAAPAAPAPEDEDESDEEDQDESDEEDEDESDQEEDKGDYLQRIWDEMVQRAKDKHDACRVATAVPPAHTLARLACRVVPPEPSTVVPVRDPPRPVTLPALSISELPASPAAVPAPAPAAVPASGELIETLMEFLKEMNGGVTAGDQRYVTALVQRFKGRVL